MTNSIVQLIKIAHLTQLKHLILFKNETSGTEIFEEDAIKVLELREKGISLIVPQNTCAYKHSLTLYMFKLPVKNKIKNMQDINKIKDRIEVIGKVTNVSKDEGEENEWTVEIDFTQYEGQKWMKFVRSYAARQGSIDSVGDEEI